MTRSFPGHDQPHIRSPHERLHQIPLAAGGFGWTRPFYKSTFQAKPDVGSSYSILGGLSDGSSQAFFMTAPSMTTPNAMDFHSATSSLRARATMVVFLPRPSAILLLNQSDSADCGWFCSHSQASSISADLRRGFPALETPVRG